VTARGTGARAFATLLLREWREARTPFFWLPFGLFVALVLLGLLLVSGAGNFEVRIEQTTTDAAAGSLPVNPFWPLHPDTVASQMEGFRTLSVAPFYLTYLVAALFVLLGALYDERRDGSILLWKSLPVSDLATVLSKLVLVVWVAPLVTLAFALLSQVYLLALAATLLPGDTTSDPTALWEHADLLHSAGYLTLGSLIQGLWTLPVTAYLLLVSAAVPRLTLLWALLAPVLPIVGERLLLGSDVIARGIVKHTEIAALGNYTFDDDRIMPVPTNAAEQLALLANADLWLGVLIGCALLWLAAQLRRIRNEL
jgi:ABC-2 type transport system permease protein